jgi:hypothetical protein
MNWASMKFVFQTENVVTVMIDSPGLYGSSIRSPSHKNGRGGMVVERYFF